MKAKMISAPESLADANKSFYISGEERQINDIVTFYDVVKI